jgi:hypothetical protein
MRWQDPHRCPYARSRGYRQDPTAHRFAPCESPAQLLPQSILARSGLKFLAKTVLAISMNAGISVLSVDRQALVDLLKWPTSVGVLRSALLEMLERQTHQKFDGDLWKMVAWAQANGLDVKSPPKRPGK